jgi:hypothetical protein
MQHAPESYRPAASECKRRRFPFPLQTAPAERTITV